MPRGQIGTSMAVNGDHVGRDIADGGAADVRRYLDAGHRHHPQSDGRRQPERVVYATGVVVDVVEVADHELHRAEPLQVRPGRPYILARHSDSSLRAGVVINTTRLLFDGRSTAYQISLISH